MYRRTLLLASVVALAILVPGVSGAQWVENGAPVCTAMDSQAQECAVSDGEGGAFFVWSDTRQFPWVMITAQRIHAGGFPVWEEDGIQVCAVDTIQLQPTAAYAGDGTVMIAWISQDGPIYTVSAQKIDREGTLVWGLDGVQITSLSGVLDEVSICADNAGGAVIAWLDSRNTGYQVYAQRLNAEGVALWAEDGQQITTSSVIKAELSMAPDGYGGAFLAWVDIINEDIYAEWVQLGGYTAWSGTDGVLVCGEINAQEDISIIADGAGGTIISWTDYRSSSFGDIYAQKIAPRWGSVMWSSGVAVCDDPGVQGQARIATDGKGGVYVIWLDGRSNDYDIYGQLLNGLGTGQWVPNGIPICNEDGLKYSPLVESDRNGGIIVAWDDQRNGSSSDVYAARVDQNYNILWPEEGLPVCTSPLGQAPSSIVVDDQSNAIIGWNDDRALYDANIYAQRIDRFGKWGFPGPHLVSVRDVPGDQGGQVNVSWEASRLDVYPNREIFYYTIWRAIDEKLALAMLKADEDLKSDFSIPSVRVTFLGGEPYYWTQVAEVPASDVVDTYAEMVPTLFDSTANSFEPHYFQVIAHSYESPHHWASAPDSCYSVDNLAPAAPLGLAGEQVYAPAGLHLTWSPNGEADLDRYHIYRGTSGDFTPEPGNFVTSTPDTSSLDGGWSNDGGFWYKVSAVDVHGNQSPFAVLAPGAVSGVDPMPRPGVTHLAHNYPNPFNPSTTIVYSLAEEGRVDLSVYDIKGRLVRTLVAGIKKAGGHQVVWQGLDKQGRSAASGVYFYRLDAGSFSETQRMVLMK